MNILHPKKIVLLGMMTRMPVAGVIWQTAHYLVGLRRLGYDVYYVEAHGCTPRSFMDEGEDHGWANAAAFIRRTLGRFDFSDKWAYHARHHDNRVYGMNSSELADLYREAALIINLHGGTVPLPEHYATGRLIFLETDPVELQIQLHDNQQEAIAYLEPHCAFFTFGENYGRPGCRLPVSDRFHFQPTRQPVVCDFWQLPDIPAGPAFTTIGNWEQSHRQVHFQGETYHWSKHHEFLKFLDLPIRAKDGSRFELALASYDDAVEQMLRGHGWEVHPAKSFSADPDAYRHYIAGSRGEFTVAKDQNIRLRTGWFSDRSATYLAAGRPVITQDTGFGNVLPTGKGLFAFQTMQDILSAVQAINANYPEHCRSAQEIAKTCFDSSVVLPALLQRVGL